MCYIIDKVGILKSDRIEQTTLLVNQNKIEFMRQSMDNIKFMRMDLSSYLITPGYVMLDFSLHSLLPFQDFKQQIIRYLKKGCTSLLTVVDIKYEKELVSNVKKRRHLMINSPIDYYMAIKLSLKSLNQSVLRKCKQQQVSIVFVEINKDDRLDLTSWGWIRDAMFSNPITLIPFTSDETLSPFKKNRLLQEWNRIVREHRISSVYEFLEEGTPLSKEILMKLGIYPVKGDIRVGNKLNYNLYKLEELKYHIDGKPIIQHNEISPTFTSHNGKLININGDILFLPGKGEECFISISGRFIPQTASF
ncbi:hypothetical protein AB3Z07_16550 [Metabacillus halosaccharovorans]|uniref:hypothetical protein n=1 Tax=Metabacillus halosaccharovorans TaxID=930124 RepID=UPI00203B1B2B|nr:hypothetical protein [Metabacillus halosaccharovorans]MCM3440788.1 hypothetical protein [Metabacillus halosaccharovorans]